MMAMWMFCATLCVWGGRRRCNLLQTTLHSRKFNGACRIELADSFGRPRTLNSFAPLPLSKPLANNEIRVWQYGIIIFIFRTRCIPVIAELGSPTNARDSREFLSVDVRHRFRWRGQTGSDLNHVVVTLTPSLKVI